MERHPVPQNIMDVEFKLFGALTIKQFTYAAGGFVVALLVYFSGLPDVLRWPFIGLALAVGFFLSVVKINGQSSTVFVSNFIISMFEPQERLWKKSAIVPDILKEDNNSQARRIEEVTGLIKKGKMDSIAPKPLADVEIPESEKQLVVAEEENLKQIEKHFNFLFEDLPQVATASVNPQIKIIVKQAENPIINKPQTLAGGVAAQQQLNDTVYQGSNYAVGFKPMNNQNPRPLTVSFNKNVNLKETNYLKGYIVNASGEPIESAAVYMLNKNGQIIRNATSLKNGSFAIASGIETGDYLIDVKKEGFKFPRYSVSLKGDKIMEIKLQAL